MRRIFAVIFLAVLLYVIYFPLKKEDPRLVVYISIDQMRYDYLERFKDQFSESGFNLLVKKGAVFTNCNFEHYCTLTAPGHAALGTGCYAGKSGITGNSWYDIQNNHSGYCVDDKNYTGLAGEKAGAKSAEQLIISTLGDELKIKNPQSKVFGISSKDRAAILMTGKKADAAFWFNKENGEYISSTYYLNIMPEWVTKYNQWGFSDFYFDRQWNKLLAENAYQNCTEDDFPYEDEPGGMGRTFPHPLNAGMDKPGEIYYSNLLYSPFGDELTIKFCKTLIENEDLGDDSNTDLLCISLSCTDYIGHAWGPDSHEMLDMQVRLDRMLQQFFQYLDKEIGMRHMVIVLTADHGVAPIPEVSLKNGIEAGRIQPARPGDRDQAGPFS